MPIFLLFVILFAFWLRYEMKKSTRIESESKDDFMEKECQSNFVRKADITNLDYISIPLSELPFIGNYDEINSSYKPSSDITDSIKAEISDCEKNILVLSHKKMLNLNGLSNTDIKMQYGAANLPLLIQYDDNFSKLSRTLAKWGKLLFEVSELAASEKVLSYAIDLKADIEDVFITLAKIYHHTGNELGISDLIEKASFCFDELRRESIIRRITSIS